MVEYKGLYLPEGEKHLQQWMDTVGHTRDGKPTYQYHKYAAALEYVKEFRCAVDVGAHVGLWSRVMALDFSTLVAFEPVPEHVRCWRKNLKDAANADLFAVALGARTGIVQMHTRTPGSSGDTSIALPGQSPNAAPAVPMHKLDDYFLEHIDFFKVDNEGYELFVVRGAAKTLLRCKPVIVIEQKPGMGQRFGYGDTAAVEYLESLGAILHKEISGDYILSWEK